MVALRPEDLRKSTPQCEGCETHPVEEGNKHYPPDHVLSFVQAESSAVNSRPKDHQEILLPSDLVKNISQKVSPIAG